MSNWSVNLSKRTHRGLRHWVLFLLQDSPRNGVEIMDATEAMSRGWWRPSPGSVYPILESMSREGVIRKRADGKYELTASGKEEMNWPKHFKNPEPRSVDEVLEQMSGYVSYLEDLSRDRPQTLGGSAQTLRDLGARLGRLGGGSK